MAFLSTKYGVAQSSPYSGEFHPDIMRLAATEQTKRFAPRNVAPRVIFFEAFLRAIVA